MSWAPDMTCRQHSATACAAPVLLQITSAAESGQRVAEDGTVKSAFDDETKKTMPGDNPVKAMTASEKVSLVQQETQQLVPDCHLNFRLKFLLLLAIRQVQSSS